MKLKIKGKKHIEGTIKISGAKNSAVAIIPAAILCDDLITLNNIPDISDVRTQIEILNKNHLISFAVLHSILHFYAMHTLNDIQYFYNYFLINRMM